MAFPRETTRQSSHCTGGSLAEVSCAPSSHLGHSPNFIKPSSPAPMDVKEHRKKTKLNCFKQAKRCRAAQRNHLPGGSTARCHPHPMPRKENCHWEKKLCFLFFFLLTSHYLFFLTKNKTLANAPPTPSAHLSSFSSSRRAQGCSGQNHRGFPPLSKLSATKQGEI